MKNDTNSFFYNALLICGAIFAIYNMVLGWVNFRNRDKNKDYAELLKENARLKRRNEELQKLIL